MTLKSYKQQQKLRLFLLLIFRHLFFVSIVMFLSCMDGWTFLLRYLVQESPAIKAYLYYKKTPWYDNTS